MRDTSEMELMLKGYGLTTAQILYHLPDHPHLLQTFIWQDYDLAPKFPVLVKFIEFWRAKLEGPLHSVQLHAQAADRAERMAQGRRRVRAALTGAAAARCAGAAAECAESAALRRSHVPHRIIDDDAFRSMPWARR